MKTCVHGVKRFAPNAELPSYGRQSGTPAGIGRCVAHGWLVAPPLSAAKSPAKANTKRSRATLIVTLRRPRRLDDSSTFADAA